jgi:CBS domain-containing protein
MQEARMKARDIMTKDPACVTADETAQRVAQLMADSDCGCIPVVDARDNDRVIGVVTDRDIAVRGVAQGRGPNTPVRELMSTDVTSCPPDADLLEVERVMTERQIRRVVVADNDGRARGIIAQADLARAAERGGDVSEREVARVVERISEPGTGSRGRGDSGRATELRF